MFKFIFLNALNFKADIIVKNPQIKLSISIVLLLDLILLYKAGSSLFNLLLAGIGIFLLPSPLPYLLNKLFSKLRHDKLVTLSITNLFKSLKKHPQQVYLGTGFIWQPHHLRLLDECLRYPLAGNKESRHGSFILHDLENDNRNPNLMSCSDLNLHTVIFGTTGAGKTRLFDLLITQAIFRNDTVIVIDPKSDSDLLAKVKHSALLCNRNLDLKHLNLSDIKASHPLNPLGTFTRVSEIASRITSLMPDSGSAQSFKAHAHSAIMAAVTSLQLERQAITLQNLLIAISSQDRFYLIAQKYIEQLVVNSNDRGAIEFYKILCKKDLSLKATDDKLLFNKELTSNFNTNKSIGSNLHNLEKVYTYLCNNNLTLLNGDILSFISIAKMDNGYYHKLIANVLPSLRTLCAGDLNQALSTPVNHATFEGIVNNNHIFYASLNCLSDPTLGGDLGKLLIADLSAVAGKIYTKEQDPFFVSSRVSIFIDEASEVSSEALVQLLNKSRGANFAVTLATQTYADLIKRCGSQEAARQIIGNCNNKITLRVKDKHTADIFTESLPQSDIPQFSSALSFSENSGLDVNYSVNRTVAFKKSPLIPSSALQYLPDLEYFAVLADGKILKGRLPLITDKNHY